MKNEKLIRTLKDYQGLFTSPEGIKVLEHMKQQYHYNSRIYQGNAKEYSMAFKDGQRSVVLDVLNILKKDLSKDK